MPDQSSMNVLEYATDILQELEVVKKELPSWGLSEKGQRTLLEAVEKFEISTELDLLAFRFDKVDIAEVLSSRLTNVKALKYTVLRQLDQSQNIMQAAQDASWIAQWMEEAEGFAASGLEPVRRIWVN